MLTLSSMIRPQAILGDKAASQSTISRFLKCASDLRTLNDLHTLMESLGDDYMKADPNKIAILDIDSTHSDTFGDQGGSNYNAHYHANGYHPFVAFEGASGVLLKAELRPGNVYTSTEAEIFLGELLDRYPLKKFIVRADSGFATPKIFDLLEKRKVNYIIRLKSNSHLQAIARSLYENNPEVNPIVLNNPQTYQTTYRAGTWKHARKIIILANQDTTSVPRYQFFVTTLGPDIFHPDDIIRAYRKRGTMENFIKELKLGFYFDKTDSNEFFINEVRMVLSGIAYNLIRLIISKVFPTSLRHQTINSIRLKLIKIGASFGHHAGKLWVHLTKSNPYRKLFWSVFNRIQALA